MNILFICTGNTCRSPMAEGLCRAKIQNENADIQVLSAGLASFVGEPVSPKAVNAVEKYVDISSHFARQVDKNMIEAADMIIAMTNAHKQTILFLYPEMKDKIVTLSELADEEFDIVDPYGQDQDSYDYCAEMIGEFLEKSWKKITEKATEI